MDISSQNLLSADKMQDVRGEWQFLRCGPLTAYFDPETAALRRVCLGEKELVRAVYVAVRDHNWNTIKPLLTDVDLTAQEQGFHLTFSVRCRERDIDFAWRGTMRGDAEGRIQFTMDGRALSTFRRNRIGFCVLHPTPACVGQPCIVQTTDGITERGAFPDLISPHQPFQNLRSLAHEAAPGVWAEVAFEGDVFEMEDQRNWTDASYKTYCTPLALPYPVLVPAGTEIRQAITITLRAEEGTGTEEHPRLGGASRQTSFGREAESSDDFPPAPVVNAEAGQTPVTLRFTDTPLPLPHIGLGIASHGQPLSAQENKFLRNLRLSHLRLDLTLSDSDWEARLRQANRDAGALNIGLEIALFVSDEAERELAFLAEVLQTLRIRLTRWIIFHAGEKVTRPLWVQMARRILAPVSPDVPIGAGTNAYFAELNRERPTLDGLDFVSYSLNSQVHAFDDASLVENLQAQADTVRSAKAFCGGLPIVVSPVTFRPRFNPNATGKDAPPDPDELPFEVDTRQMSLLGAGWTLGSLKALCEAGAHSVTYYETTGWRGVMEAETGSLLPEQFPSVSGKIFPLYDVFHSTGQFAGGTIQPMASSDPLRIIGMALQKENRQSILCANMTEKSQFVRLILPSSFTHLCIWQMDADNVEYFDFNPGRSLTVENGTVKWELPAYAFAHIDRSEWVEGQIELLSHGASTSQ